MSHTVKTRLFSRPATSHVVNSIGVLLTDPLYSHAPVLLLCAPQEVSADEHAHEIISEHTVSRRSNTISYAD